MGGTLTKLVEMELKDRLICQKVLDPFMGRVVQKFLKKMCTIKKAMHGFQTLFAARQTYLLIPFPNPF